MPNEQTLTPTSTAVAAPTATITAAAAAAVGAIAPQTEVENGSVEHTNKKSNVGMHSLLATDWEEEIASKAGKTETTSNEKCVDGTAIAKDSSIAATMAATTATVATATTATSFIATISKPATARKSSNEGRRGRPPRSSQNNISTGSANCDISSNAENTAGSTFYHGIYSTLNEFYRGQQNAKAADAKDAIVGNDLLSYYQLVRQFYEQPMSANVLKANENVMEPTKAAATTVTATMNALNKKQETNGIAPSLVNQKKSNDLMQIPPHNGTQLGIKSEEMTPSAELRYVTTNRSQKSLSKTTPPKKRYSEYSHVEDATTDVTRVNLSHRFDVATLVPDCVGKSNGSGHSGLPDAQNQLVNVAKMDVDALPQRDKASPSSGSNDSAASMADVRPITSTYLQLMRSMGLTDEDALKFDHLVSWQPFYENIPTDLSLNYR